MFVSVVIVLLVSVKMAPAWRSVTLSPFSTFTQSTKSHKTQSHTVTYTKHMANCNTRCTTTQCTGSYKVHHHTRHTVIHVHALITKSTINTRETIDTTCKVTHCPITRAHHHTCTVTQVTHARSHNHTCTRSHKTTPPIPLQSSVM